mmetsp:Transcript_5969/g.12499  ORF Transcript_5969/g.12499 Transcript_5969/m.12499 type:complete len:115 (-) Transcript_5969:629-973(-)
MSFPLFTATAPSPSVAATAGSNSCLGSCGRYSSLNFPQGFTVVYLPPLPWLMRHPWILGGAMPPEICTLLDGSVQRSLLPCWIVSEIKNHKNRHVSRTKKINRLGALLIVGPTI